LDIDPGDIVFISAGKNLEKKFFKKDKKLKKGKNLGWVKNTK
jgi:hypothetical protein